MMTYKIAVVALLTYLPTGIFFVYATDKLAFTNEQIIVSTAFTVLMLMSNMALNVALLAKKHDIEL